MDSSDEFLQALKSFLPPRPAEIEYRVYYDASTGQILNYTNEILPGDYITVDRETFARHRFDCSVKDGKIVPFRLPIGKLVPSSTGTPCHAKDICLIESDPQSTQHWSMHTYED